jgi:seryl-tRNA synthetase
MLSITSLRDEPEAIRADLERRGDDTAPVGRALVLDEQRRALLAEVESMRADRNEAGRLIGAAKSDEERQRLIEEQRAVAGRLDELEAQLSETDAALDEVLLTIPNRVHPDVQDGDEEDAVVILEGVGRDERRVDPPLRVADATDPEPEGNAEPHWDLGEALGVIDFERGVKLAGAHFYILRGNGARLQRALIAWMLDRHRERGYVEVYPPALVREDMLVGTGQLPKFGDTMFHLEGQDLWLVPTAEVPVTNMYREEILDAEALPIRHTAYTPCFRQEQFSAGRDTRGIKRGFQFDKVELVHFVAPDRSWEAHVALLDDALEIVRTLGLRWRVIRLAARDTTFASAMTYDIELWAPGAGEWLEVSSVSNFLDFQARRANLRFRNAEGRVEHLHTLNGSGVALPRLVAAILETNQLEDGSVEVPEVLRPYLGGLEAITAAE